MSDGPWDDFKGGGAAVADGPWNDFPAAPARAVTTAQDEQASADQIGNIMEPEGHVPDPVAASEGVLQESHPYAWARIRQTPFMRKLLGPTDEERAAMANGTLAGPPGGDPGLVPILMNSPSPFVPGPESRAGQVLLSYFVARNVASLPERIAAINQKFNEGDTQGAWHDILGDTLDTGMAALGALSLAGKAGEAMRNAAAPEPDLDTMRRVYSPNTPPAELAARLLSENAAATDLGTVEAQAQAGVVAVTPEMDAAVRQGMKPAPPATEPVTPTVPGLSGAKPGESPTVPETPAEPERNLTVLEEIRAKKAQTIAQIQNLFPQAQLTREQARSLRNSAWGAPVQPPAEAEPEATEETPTPAETPPPTGQAEVVPTQPEANGDVKGGSATGQNEETPETAQPEAVPAIDTRTPEQRVPGPNYVWNPANPLDENPPSAPQSVSVAGMPDGESFNGNINAARDWALKNLRGTVTNQKTGLPIEIARAGVEKALSSSAVKKSPNVKDHVDAVRAVPQLLSTADLVESRPAQKNPQNIGGILRFHAPLKVNGNPYTARLTVREHINPKGRKFYTYELMELEKEKPAVTAQGAGGAGKGSSAKAEFPAATTAGTPESTVPGAKVNPAKPEVLPPVKVPNVPKGTRYKIGPAKAAEAPWRMTKEQWSKTVKAEYGMQGFPDLTAKLQTDATHRKEVEMALESGKPVPPKVLKDYPDLLKPAEAPAQAAAKVEEHVQDVARTEGARPAKEVKSELVQRVEAEIAKLGPEPALLFSEPRKTRGKREFYVYSPDKSLRILARESIGTSWSLEHEKTNGKTGALEKKAVGTASGDIREATRAAGSAMEQLMNPKAGNVTIKIPGDGTFTIARTHWALNTILAKARALDTRATVKPSVRKMASDTYQPGDLSLTEEEWLDPATITKLDAAIEKPQTEEARRVLLAALDQAKKLQGVTEAPPENKVAGFGGGTRKAQKVSVPAGTPATAPATSPLRQYLGNQAAGVQSVVAPQTLAPDARAVGNALRHFMGQNALAMAWADEVLQSWRVEFDKTPVPADYQYDPAQPLPHNYAVIDALERDRAALPTRYRDLADVFDKEFAWRIAEIQKFAPNALQHLIQNYFPHVWQDPKRAADVMAQVATRLFAGRKEFLKQRSLPFFGEGLAAGLKPISDNPVDLLMAKMHSMDKFILALRATSEFRATGAMKFKYLFERLPEGWTTIDDPSFIVQRPPVVTVTEAHDEFQRAKLGEILKDMGVSYKRVASLGGRRWAEADLGMKEIRAKVGASEDILWHELGHQLDWKFPGLRNALAFTGNSPIAAQLRALVDLNHPGVPHDPKKNYHRYLRKTEEKMAEIFRAYVHAPDLFQKTAPDVWQVVKKFLDTQPALRAKLDEMSHGRMAIGSESTQIKLGGMQQLGHWIMPVGPAQVIRNYLSPGLARFGVYRAFRGASNILNAAQLGLSAFHLGFTSLDAATSRLAIGIEDAAHGNLARAAKTLASIPASPVTNILQGRRMIAEARTPGSTDPETAALVRALEQAGGRIGQDAFWKTHFTRRMIRALHETRNNSGLVEMPDVKALLNAPFALVEQALRPIMDYIVPRQKLGVFADMARREIERLGPNAALDQTREAMRLAWDSVDNRMGQLVYDNLFYNRAVKDLALLSFRAYGWQLGKYREGLGAAVDTTRAAKALGTGKQPGVTHRMAYAMALPMMIGMLGALATYLMTRRRAQGMDYFMPPTGETDSHGNPVRLNFPSYMKDVLAYGKHPITSFSHSLNPMFSGMFDLYENKDFYDVEIRHPDDPLWKQGSEVAQFAAKQFTPFSVSGAMKLREDASPMQKQVLPFFGITPAPSRMTMTPAQELASDLMASGMGDEPLTQEQFDKSKMIRDAVRAIKTGKGDGTKVLGEAIASGKLNPDATSALIDRLKYTPLQFQVFHLGTADAMKVWRVADPNEQAELQPLLVTKILNSKVVKPEDKAKYLGELARPAH
jgi:hypothetical protein